MALKRAANGYDYYVPETEWDVLPEQQRQRRRVERHVQKERVEVTYEVHPSQLARRKNAIANCLTAAAVVVMLIAVLFG